MNPKSKLMVAAVLTLSLITACNNAPDAAKETSATPAAAVTASAGKEMAKPDYAAIAQKLVSQCAGVKEGEIVSISGEIKDAELLEELSIEVRKLGAFPLMNMYHDNPERQKRALQEIPAKWDSQTNQLSLKLAGMTNVNISINNSEPVNLLEHFPQERLEAMSKANEPVSDLSRKRNIRTLVLGGNGLYPSKANAQELGLTQAELAKIFWDGINTDYDQLQADGEKYRQLLSAAKEAHLTHPNGTDLKVKIEKRPVFANDGVISADDIKRGGPAVEVWLPAGEVYVTPVPGTAEGRIVVDRYNYLGASGPTLIEGLTLDFKAGKLVSMTARSGLEPFKRAYDKLSGKAAEGKDQFSVIDLGINRSLVLGPNAKRGDYAPAGTISVGYGGNIVYGGENKAVGRFETNLLGTTLELDGKVVVENGTLK